MQFDEFTDSLIAEISQYPYTGYGEADAGSNEDVSIW
jgi:hypothetical protein